MALAGCNLPGYISSKTSAGIALTGQLVSLSPVAITLASSVPTVLQFMRGAPLPPSQFYLSYQLQLQLRLSSAHILGLRFLSVCFGFISALMQPGFNCASVVCLFSLLSTTALRPAHSATWRLTV